MSIKRPSRSSGTTVHRPTTSPGVHHVDVAAPNQMVPGDLYSGWLCKNRSCGALIAIAVPQAGKKPAAAESDDQLIVIKCPHCADENLYRWGTRSEHKYTPKGA